MLEKTKAGAHLTCRHCNNEWRQRYDKPPKVCPGCMTKYWDSEPSRPATVQKIPKLAEKSEPEDFYLGVRIMTNGKYGTVLFPQKPSEKTKEVELVFDFGDICGPVPIDSLKIVLEDLK
ncbi:MAG: hypothetical protein ACT6FG_00500 [Methanosarcinaceae archaeon]